MLIGRFEFKSVTILPDLATILIISVLMMALHTNVGNYAILRWLFKKCGRDDITNYRFKSYTNFKLYHLREPLFYQPYPDLF